MSYKSKLRLIYVELDNEPLQAYKISIDKTLKFLRDTKLQKFVSYDQKFCTKNTPISIDDEVSIKIEDILIDDKQIIMKTAFDKIIIEINGKSYNVEANLKMSLSELRNLYPKILLFTNYFLFDDAPIEIKEEYTITISEIINQNKIYLKEKKNKPDKKSLEMNEKLKQFLNIDSIDINEFQKCLKDENGNPVSSDFDLGKDGAFSNYKLLIGCFYIGENLPEDIQNKTAIPALECKSFMQVKMVTTEIEFTKLLKDFDIAWVISNTSFQSNKDKENEFFEEIDKHLKQKKGLMLWGDNDPYYYHANKILEKISMGNNIFIELTGNSYGTQMLKRSEEIKNGSFIQHQITTGLSSNNEGVTICHPINKAEESSKNLGDLNIIGLGSSGLPTFMVLEGSQERGRIIIDCGFTKLIENFFAGNFRYVRNCAVWILWIERIQNL